MNSSLQPRSLMSSFSFTTSLSAACIAVGVSATDLWIHFTWRVQSVQTQHHHSASRFP